MGRIKYRNDSNVFMGTCGAYEAKIWEGPKWFASFRHYGNPDLHICGNGTSPEQAVEDLLEQISRAKEVERRMTLLIWDHNRHIDEIEVFLNERFPLMVFP